VFGLTKNNVGWQTSDVECSIGIIVDAGKRLGYGHAVRCVRLSGALQDFCRVVFYPLSDTCAEFLASASPASEIRRISDISSLPPVVITDLREPHGISAMIRRHGSRHISLHDLGLAQCQSDVAIDGSVMRLFPYLEDKGRELHLGSKYMITRRPVERREIHDSVLITLGGGATAEYTSRVTESISALGLEVISTRGFSTGSPLTETELESAIATCRFAIASAGTSLYDLLASGVPTIAVAFDTLQLRTADAFQELGAVLSAGLIQRVSPSALLGHCKEVLSNQPLIHRLSHAGQTLVDGNGLSRVADIARRQLWLTTQTKTSMVC
jgi:spore coat polysaccharide biosynthesis predicted glycosyltransferase SpsG